MDEGAQDRGTGTSVRTDTEPAWSSLLPEGVVLRLSEAGGDDAIGGISVLDDPDLVLSEGYIGPDRRAGGLRARLHRKVFEKRRGALGVELLVLTLLAVVTTSGFHPESTGARPSAVSIAAPSVQVAGHQTFLHPAARAVRPHATRPKKAPATNPSTTVAPATPTTGQPEVPAAPAALSAPSTSTAPASAPTTVVAAQPAPDPPTAPASSPPAGLTPSQMGAAALALVRYPWRSIPNYSIQFHPISEAPSPGFYGNTTFTWGQVGGVSDLYIYPGETVAQLAGIIGFEIAHEVDAAALYSAGESQIENALGYHPASWAPNCDCAEQNFLSGWYAEVFSNYWTPGVGDWTGLDGLPSVAPAWMKTYLNPKFP